VFSEDESQLPFRFLDHKEFMALTQEEKIVYLQRAAEAMRNERALDDPDRNG
jgi:hypothetical protein